MTRAWIATALLAGSWVFGLGYLGPANHVAWGGLVALASVLLAGAPMHCPDRRQMLVALVLLTPAVLLIPLPYKAMPVLLAASLAIRLTPIPRRWPRMLGRGAATAATILLAQSLVVQAYWSLTARRHGLPQWLGRLVSGVVRLLGVDAVEDGGSVAFRSLQDTTRIGATWELLLDPATVCFLAGGLVMLALAAYNSLPRGRRWKPWARRALILLAATLVWAPIRLGLLAALVVHRALRAETLALPNAGEILVSAWVHILLLAAPVLLVVRLIRKIPAAPRVAPSVGAGSKRSAGRRRAAACIAAGLGVAMLVVALCWVPVGQRTPGRVMVVERHSRWEPTTEPYGTAVYGEAGSYNYAAIYAYCSQYYEMSRLLESEPINDARLRRCDALVIKTPTSRYSTNEVAAVVRFVEQGGSLLLIGDHTNVFNMNTCLNDISRRFGFTFRNDLLFRIGDPYYQKYRPPLLAHPIVQRVPPMHFAVSCSIDPGSSVGRMAVCNAGLWSLPPAYHESNYHPQAEYRPVMQYGAWCQLWSACHGKGRVLGFGDSTLFSNFCTHQPGKAELLMGMLEWLNHHSAFDGWRARGLLAASCVLAGALLLAVGAWFGWRGDAAWVTLAGAGAAGWAAAAMGVITVHRASMPQPRVRQPMVHVVIDRNLSEAPLFTGAFADERTGAGYGLFEQWIPRIGSFTSRRTGRETFAGDGLVIICPCRSVTPEYRDQLTRFVKSGGRLLVVDSADLEGSTANGVLWPFGMASIAGAPPADGGKLRWAWDAPETPLKASCEITGGEPIAWLGETPAAARVRFGKGMVTAIGFGSLFTDASMGGHWLAEPDAETRQRYEVLFALLRASLPARPLPRAGQ